MRCGVGAWVGGCVRLLCGCGRPTAFVPLHRTTTHPSAMVSADQTPEPRAAHSTRGHMHFSRSLALSSLTHVLASLSNVVRQLPRQLLLDWPGTSLVLRAACRPRRRLMVARGRVRRVARACGALAARRPPGRWHPRQPEALERERHVHLDAGRLDLGATCRAVRLPGKARRAAWPTTDD